MQRLSSNERDRKLTCGYLQMNETCLSSRMWVPVHCVGKQINVITNVIAAKL